MRAAVKTRSRTPTNASFTIFFAYAYANPNAASHVASSGGGARASRVAVRRDVGERVIDAFIYGASVYRRVHTRMNDYITTVPLHE